MTVLRSLTHRELLHYPRTASRYASLGITVAVTVLLYYQLYVNGAVATSVIRDLHMTFSFYVGVLVLGNALGAFGSLAAGAADRFGRANLVTYGLLVVAGLTTFAMPHVHSKGTFGVVYALVSIAEGVVLVATPALVRDFSPQLGRASAMGFWTLGPVVGSLITTEVSSHTLDDAGVHWRHQFVIAGIVGLVVFAIALVALRELSPALRDQLMVSMEDRDVVEAQAAKGVVRSSGVKNLLSARLLTPALGISVYLLFYYTAVAFLVIFLQTVEGRNASDANDLLNYYWAANAVALVVFGWLSDRLKVRKPLMVVGGVGSVVITALVISKTGHTPASHDALATLLLLTGVFGGLAFAPWMAAFTENVEARDPSHVATGLAAWGWILRVTVALGFALLPQVITSVTPLVDDGPRALALQARYGPQIATAQKLDPATSAALAQNPNDTAAQLTALRTLSKASLGDVVKAGQILQSYPQELTALQAVDPATLLALQANPADAAAGLKAVGEISTALRIDVLTARTRLLAAAKVPQADLIYLFTTGKPVADAAASLQKLSAVPKADLAFLQTSGVTVQKAQHRAPDEWKRWFWVCLGGQAAFLLFVLVMEGPWTPRRAAAEIQQRRRALASA